VPAPAKPAPATPPAGQALYESRSPNPALPLMRIADPPTPATRGALVDASPPASGPAGAPNAGAPGARTSGSGSTTKSGATTTSAIPGAIGNNVPAMVEQMQFNYLKLNHVTPMLLLCANNLDPSVPYAGNESSWPDAKTCTEFAQMVVQSELNYSQAAIGSATASARTRRPARP
jgi:hypothetical protein